MRAARLLLGGMALANLGVSVLFALLALKASIVTPLDVRIAFTELDRAGVINPAALSQFHPSYGFTTTDLGYRSQVPDFIAGSALRAEKGNAILGCLVAGGNAVILGWGFLRMGRYGMAGPPSVAKPPTVEL